MYSVEIMNHRDIIGLWPSIAEMARDLGLSDDQYVLAYSWNRRGSIPHKYWKPLVVAAKKRNLRKLKTTEVFLEAA